MVETALWLLSESLACAVGAKANVPFASAHKIELIKMCSGENKKYRMLGKDCWLTRCPFAIWSVCLWSPVKMVYFFLVFSRLFFVVESSFTLAANLFIQLGKLYSLFVIMVYCTVLSIFITW